jgi:hypothetical protein
MQWSPSAISQKIEASLPSSMKGPYRFAVVFLAWLFLVQASLSLVSDRLIVIDAWTWLSPRLPVWASTAGEAIGSAVKFVAYWWQLLTQPIVDSISALFGIEFPLWALDLAVILCLSVSSIWRIMARKAHFLALSEQYLDMHERGNEAHSLDRHLYWSQKRIVEGSKNGRSKEFEDALDDDAERLKELRVETEEMQREIRSAEKRYRISKFTLWATLCVLLFATLLVGADLAYRFL